MLHIALWNRLLIWAICLAGVVLTAPNLFYARVERANDARAALVEGAAPTPEQAAAMAGWPSWLPHTLVPLGLDLRGGAHLLAEVKVGEVYRRRMDAFWPELRDALVAERATVGPVRRLAAGEGELRVQIGTPEGMARAIEIARGLARPILTLTGIGASDYEVASSGDTLVVTLSEAERAATHDRTMQQSIEIVRRRIDEVGTREPTIARQGTDRILIQVPGIGSAAELKGLIGTTAQLTFHPVVSRTTDAKATPGVGNLILPSLDEPGVYYIIEAVPVVTGEELVDAQPSFDQNNRPAVNFRFNPSGARKFGDYTAQNIGSPFAIVLDGEVVSAPVIQSHIPGGSGIITGRFTVEESTRLAVLLRAGALPAEMTFLEERTIGPELGQDSIDAGRVAAVVAAVAVVVLMVASYGLFGVFATAALALNMALIIGTLSAIGATLTLPGIAGIVLTIGMAVDANVLIYERMREELRQARGPARAIDQGFARALSAIVDANVTTFIVAVILYALGSGPVRGFAITLGLGILTSVFTAVYVTRLIIISWLNRRRPKTIVV